MGRDRRARVVVAEDDYLVSEEVIRSIEQAGFELVGDAATGVEAVELTRKMRPDLVFMDIKMPEMDGLEASRRIQEECPTPVVVLTAHETGDLVAEAALSGVGAYLTKPPEPREIERAATVALARFQDMQRIRQLNEALETQNRELQHALDRIETLEGFLSICSYCKKIRDGEDHWLSLTQYVSSHTKARPSHGICPDCESRLMGDFESWADGVAQR